MAAGPHEYQDGIARAFTDEELAEAARALAAEFYGPDIEGWMLSLGYAITFDAEQGRPRLFFARRFRGDEEGARWPMGHVPVAYLDEPETLTAVQRERLTTDMVSGAWELLRQ